MKIFKTLVGLFLAGCITSCPSKKEQAAGLHVSNANTNLTVSQTIVLKTVDANLLKTKNQAQVFRFLASLETEILKLIIPASLPTVNQFDVISYAFDLQAQIKRPSLKSYECQIIKLITTEKKITVLSQCEKPHKTLAEIDILTDTLYVIRFINSSWASVVGLSAMLQPEPRECVVKIKSNTPHEMDCTNTTYTLKADSHLQYLKIKKYHYKSKKDTADSNEVIIDAGVYKDLIEIKKIKMTVPFSGQIKIIEKEIEVKDDFANYNEQAESVNNKIEKSTSSQTKVSPAANINENGLEYKEESYIEPISDPKEDIKDEESPQFR